MHTKGRNWLCELPLVLIIFATNINFLQFTSKGVASRGILEGDFIRAITFGSVYCFAALSLIGKLSQALKLLRGELGYIAFLGFVLLSVLWSSNPLNVITAFGHNLGFVLIGAAAAVATNGELDRLARIMLRPLIVLLCVSFLVAVFIPGIGVDVESGKPRWMGITYHPNNLGIVSLITVWSICCLWQNEKRLRLKLMLTIFLILAGVCLFKSNSMTSIVISIGLVSCLPLWIIADRVRRPVAVSIFVLIYSLVVMTLTIYVLEPTLLSAEGFLDLVGRSKTLTGRKELWEIALNAYEIHPWFGWSFDSLLSLSKIYNIQYTQLHNGYLDLLVRGGIVGVLLILVIALRTFCRIIRAYNFSPVNATGCLALWAVVMLHNITEASLGRAPHMIWLMFTVLVYITVNFLREASRQLSRP